MTMRTLQEAAMPLVVPALLFLAGAGISRQAAPGLSETARHDPIVVTAVVVGDVDDAASTTESDEAAQTSAAPNFNLNWWSVNSGGESELATASYRVGMSVGQPVAGEFATTNYRVGFGFWYGMPVADPVCLIDIAGDVNMSGTMTPADIIYLVNFVFKEGDAPLPCVANGDVNCTGNISPADIIYLVNFVFKDGDPACDICAGSTMPCH